MHTMLLHHPFPRPDTSAQGLGQATSHLQLESQEQWLLEVAAAVCLPA